MQISLVILSALSIASVKALPLATEKRAIDLGPLVGRPIGVGLRS